MEHARDGKQEVGLFGCLMERKVVLQRWESYPKMDKGHKMVLLYVGNIVRWRQSAEIFSTCPSSHSICLTSNGRHNGSESKSHTNRPSIPHAFDTILESSQNGIQS